MAASGWSLLWMVESIWNPLAFWALWTGAALVMWAAGPTGYPSVRRHVVLAAISIPLWWWFELANERVANWEYVFDYVYPPLLYGLLSSIAFSTVVPALVAATSLWGRVTRLALPTGGSGDEANPPWIAWWLAASGVALQILAYALPDVFYPFTWIAPFLLIDGLVAGAGGRSMTADLIRGRWREALLIGAAGLTCGLLWEFWNYWAYPKWEYEIPLLGFAKVFEMPVLGYGGYVPFAWSVLQAVRLADALAARGTRVRVPWGARA